MLFLESAPAALADLRQGVARDDPGLLRRASHILWSSAAAVGALALSSRCKELEALPRGSR